MMIRLHSLTSNEQQNEDAEVGQTYWLTTDVARQFISILEAGIAKIEATDYVDRDYKKH
jgi:biofilm regulator BssS